MLDDQALDYETELDRFLMEVLLLGFFSRMALFSLSLAGGFYLFLHLAYRTRIIVQLQ